MMVRSRRAAFCAALLAFTAVAPIQAAAADKPGSTHLQCDGQPPHQSGAALTGRILLIMATGGLSGPGELSDASKRLEGETGIAACNDAISKETDTGRKLELTLAKAIHMIEAKDLDGALGVVRGLDAVAGAKAADKDYRLSLKLSAMELEANILLRQDKAADAEALALRMAALAPYDLVLQQHAIRYLGLTSEMTPDKRMMLDQYQRIAPQGVGSVAADEAWAGDFAGAAADLVGYADLINGFVKEDSPDSPDLTARSAADFLLAGDATKANTLAEQAQKDLDKLKASGKANAETQSRAQEYLDFLRMAKLLADGQTTTARAAFSVRTSWVWVLPPEVAALAEKMADKATPDELKALGKTPAEIRTAGLATRRTLMIEGEQATKSLYNVIRPYRADASYTALSNNTWRADRSPYMIKRNGREPFQGELIDVVNGNGFAAGEALLLHCALVAKQRGAKGFVLHPVRNSLAVAIVRFGNPGDAGLPDAFLMKADDVIAGISGNIPQPTARR